MSQTADLLDQPLPVTLEYNYLCKVLQDSATRYAVLCANCRNRISAYRRISLSAVPCEQCGAPAPIEIAQRSPFKSE